MTDKEILKKAIHKAEKNGYYTGHLPSFVLIPEYIEEDGTIDNGEWYDCHSTYSIQQVIFSHDFAKAFWGEDEIRTDKLDKDSVFRNDSIYDHEYESSWIYHLQRMVLEEEPLKYLERFL